MDLDISVIADDELILDIFKFKYWSVDEGIDFLTGIFEVHEVDGVTEVITLAGQKYREPEHENEISALDARHARIKAMWKHDAKKGSRYFPTTFVKWGLKYREVVKLSWLGDAQQKGLMPQDIDKPLVKPEKELTPSEKKSLLKIIAGLTMKAYKAPIPRQGIQKQIFSELQTHGVGVAEGTLSKHLKAAWDELPKEVEQPKPQ